jgi:hypothetical protein
MTVIFLRSTIDDQQPTSFEFDDILAAESHFEMRFSNSDAWVSEDGIERIYPADETTRAALVQYKEASSYPLLRLEDLNDIGIDATLANAIVRKSALSSHACLPNGVFVLRGEDQIKIAIHYLLGEKVEGGRRRAGEEPAHKSIREDVNMHVDYRRDFAYIQDVRGKAINIGDLISRGLVESKSLGISYDLVNEDTPSLSQVYPVTQSTGTLDFVQRVTQPTFNRDPDKGLDYLFIESHGLSIDEDATRFVVTDKVAPPEPPLLSEADEIERRKQIPF